MDGNAKTTASESLNRTRFRNRTRFVGAAVFVVMLILLAIAFATAKDGRTIFGSLFGGDYGAFYVAGKAPLDQLYDRELHNRLVHQLLPALSEEESLPYANPPFLALAFRPLARLPYAWSFAAWLVISLALYVAGLRLLQPREEQTSVLLLALSFEPFVIECWAGGQLSAIGFATLALAIWSVRRGRDALAGAALGFCLYKPTLLVLLLPMLLVGRRWKTLAAFAGVSLFLVLVSFVAAGRQACADYLGVLREYVNATAHGAAIFPKWKFVNVSAWMGWKLMLLVSSPALALLTRAWCKRDGDAALLWACTLVWTLVVNLHVGIYDVVLAIPCVLLLAERRLWRELKWTIALLYVTPWFSQQLARATGVQMLSLVLAGLGVIALREIALAGVRGFSLESHQ